MKITKNTTLGQLLDSKPESIKILQKYMGEIGCLSCPGRQMETLAMGAEVHGVAKKDFTKMLKELQAPVKKIKSKKVLKKKTRKNK